MSRYSTHGGATAGGLAASSGLTAQEGLTTDQVSDALAQLRDALTVRDLPALLAANENLRQALEQQRRLRTSRSEDLQQPVLGEVALCAELLVRAQAHNLRALGVYFEQPPGYGALASGPFTSQPRP